MYYLTAGSMMLLGLILMTISGLVFGLVFWRRTQRRRRIEARKRRLVMETLRMAMTSRCSFDVQVESTKGQPLRAYRAHCIGIDANGVTLGLEGANAEQILGCGRLHVYFRIASAQHVRFFDFYASATSAERRGGVTQVEFPLPSAFGNQQRRSFVRFTPSELTLPGLGLWFGKVVVLPPAMAGGAVADTMVTGKQPHPTQSLQWRTVSVASVRVLDVSAGGVKLQLPALADELWESLGPNQLFLLQFTLQEPAPKHPAPSHSLSKTPPAHGSAHGTGHGTGHAEADSAREPSEGAQQAAHATGPQPVALAVVGESVRVGAGPKPGQHAVGLRFRRWTPVVAGHKAAWVVLKDNEGIPPLSTWILRRQGEQVRHLGDGAMSSADFDLRIHNDEDDE